MSTVLTGRKAGLSRELIVEQAVQLSAIGGAEGWLVRDIIHELGVAPSVAYHYFPDKEAIRDAVVDRVHIGIEIPNPDLEWRT